MRFVSDFTDFELIDAVDGERLERWGEVLLVRPDPQVVWGGGRRSPLWDKAHARYERAASGGGHWEVYSTVPDVWSVGYMDLTFRLKPMGFKHTGLFPEQAVNWQLLHQAVKAAGRPVKALNLFAYTGGATLAMLSAGAQVTHVDASKGMVGWARENAAQSGLETVPARWLVDDCLKFVRRELRRGSRYDIVVLDPPSYGRGPDGEVFKLEDQLFELLTLCGQLLSDEAICLLLNSYTTGVGNPVLRYLLEETAAKGRGGAVTSEEIGLPVTARSLILPCGNTTLWKR